MIEEERQKIQKKKEEQERLQKLREMKEQEQIKEKEKIRLKELHIAFCKNISEILNIQLKYKKYMESIGKFCHYKICEKCEEIVEKIEEYDLHDLNKVIINGFLAEINKNINIYSMTLRINDGIQII